MEGPSFHGQDPSGGVVDAEYFPVKLLPVILGRLHWTSKLARGPQQEATPTQHLEDELQ